MRHITLIEDFDRLREFVTQIHACHDDMEELRKIKVQDANEARILADAVQDASDRKRTRINSK